MLKSIAYFMILGKPVTIWLGIITLLCLIFTAIIPWLNKKGISKIPFGYHMVFAKITIALAVLHAILVMSRFI